MLQMYFNLRANFLWYFFLFLFCYRLFERFVFVYSYLSFVCVFVYEYIVLLSFLLFFLPTSSKIVNNKHRLAY